MRVIAGTAKGRKLKAPRGRTIRPTSDRVKEAIFNMIGTEVVGASVLDLFAGTGALGIEALSRGAEKSTFVDESRKAVSLVDENLRLTDLRDKGKVIKGKVETVIERLVGERELYNLIFLDPPYRISVTMLSSICQRVADALLAADGLMILEHSSKLESPDISGVKNGASKKYGDTAVTVYRKEGTGDDGDMPGEF